MDSYPIYNLPRQGLSYSARQQPCINGIFFHYSLEIDAVIIVAI